LMFTTSNGILIRFPFPLEDIPTQFVSNDQCNRYCDVTSIIPKSVLYCNQ
jgi:hypothetical protein